LKANILQNLDECLKHLNLTFAVIYFVAYARHSAMIKRVLLVAAYEFTRTDHAPL